MTITVAAFCTYLTNVEFGWRPSDYAACNFVKAVKGKPLVGTYSDIPMNGVTVRLTEANRSDAVGWFGPWAWKQVSTAHPSGPITLVPIPSSAAIVGYVGDYAGLVLARQVADLSGGRATVADTLRWTRQFPPAHQGGVRDPKVLLGHLALNSTAPIGNVVLVDDVLTKGGHLLAAAERLRGAGDRPRFAVVAGRTVLEPPEDPFETVVEHLDELEPDLPGYRSYRVSTNGRGVAGRGLHGFASLWVPDDRRGDFTGMVKACRERHAFAEDFRWQDVSAENAAFHVDLIESFFRDNRFMVHMIITAASTSAEVTARAADPHLARCLVMLHQMKMRFFASGAEPEAFHVRLAYQDADPDVGGRARALENDLKGGASITVLDQQWAGNAFVQLADLMLTAVMADWARAPLTKGQESVRNAIVAGLGWEAWGDLHGDTQMYSWKFNIWTYHNPRIGLARQVMSRSVKEYTPYRAEWVRRKR